MQKTSNHPVSLRAFFATEMWERYGFYVVQTLLALYLVLQLQWPDKRVYALVGSFTALAYLSPLVGGWIADHLLGQKRVILLGALILMGSYFALSMADSDNLLNAALAGIAVGTGLLKPNISSLLGNEYPEGSPHRENGFMIFYMGLTIGIVLGTTFPSYLSQHFGWSVAFFSASLGMILATTIFSFSIYWCKIQDYLPHRFQWKTSLLALTMIGVLWLGAYYVLHYPHLADLVFSCVIMFSVLYFFWCVRGESAAQARQTVALGLLCFIAVLFWAFNFQIFLSLTLFILRVVQPSFLGIPLPPPYYVGIESIGMIVLGCVLVTKKISVHPLGQGVRVANKFLASMCIMALAYFVLVCLCYFSPAHALLSPLYLIIVYLMFSWAEMLLSPVGLYAVTLLASRKQVSTLMGVFLAAIGIGSFLSGKLALLTAVPEQNVLPIDIRAHYTESFTHLWLILMAVTVLCFALHAVIKHLLRKAALFENANLPNLNE